MKKTVLLAAAAALFAATPAFAQSGGSVGLNYTSIEDEEEGFQIDGEFGSTSGAIGFQVDAGFGQFDDTDSTTIAGHLFYNGGNWRLGGVVAFTNLEFDGDGVDETAYGVEGSFDLGPQTVVLGSYTVGEAEFLADLDTSYFDVGLNHYFTDNFRVGGSYGFGNLESTGGDVDASNWRLNAEWAPFTSPISFTAGYNSFDVDDSGDSLSSWSIGARWGFGGGTLRERDNATPFDTRTGFWQRFYDIY